MIHHDFKTQKTTEPSTCPARITNPTTQKEKEAIETMGYALDTAQGGEGMLQNTLGLLTYQATEPLAGWNQQFFYFIEEKIIPPHLRKSTINFRKSLEVRLKLAVTLRHLSTGESYTLLQFH